MGVPLPPTVGMVIRAKLNDHPDSTVGILTQGGRGYGRTSGWAGFLSCVSWLPAVVGGCVVALRVHVPPRAACAMRAGAVSTAVFVLGSAC